MHRICTTFARIDRRRQADLLQGLPSKLLADRQLDTKLYQPGYLLCFMFVIRKDPQSQLACQFLPKKASLSVCKREAGEC